MSNHQDLLVRNVRTKELQLFVQDQSQCLVNGQPVTMTDGNRLYHAAAAAAGAEVLCIQSSDDAEDVRNLILCAGGSIPNPTACISCLIHAWDLPDDPVIRKGDFITLAAPADADERTRYLAGFWCWVIGIDPETDRVALSCNNRMGAVPRSFVTRIQRISKYHPQLDFMHHT